jgi:hypothetical protein
MEKRIRQKIEFRPRMKRFVGRIKYWDEGAGKWTRTPMTDLGTDDEALATERYERWVETGVLPASDAGESFGSAALRIVESHLSEGKAVAKDRLARLRAHAIPKIGHVAVGELRRHHVATTLDAMGERGLSAGAMLKMRSDISAVLAYLERKGVLSENVALGVELSEDAEDDTRERLTLTDEEYLRFWQARGFETELDMMVLFSRCLAAERTSDLHAHDWSGFDRESWATCLVRRPKTDMEQDSRGRTRRGRRQKAGGRKRASRSYHLVTHAIDPFVRGPLEAYWRRMGQPASGPVFPYLRGPKAGERKAGRGISYAKAFRQAVWEAGLRRPLPGYEQAIGKDKRKFCALQVETDTTRPLDFHGHRAAAITALCQAGVSDLELGSTVGHSQPKTSAGYLRRRTVGMPASALPSGTRPGGSDPLPTEPPQPPQGPSLGAQRAAAREGAKAAALEVLAGVLGGDRAALEEGR